jgi:site-specific DNA-cytosine methylase
MLRDIVRNTGLDWGLIVKVIDLFAGCGGFSLGFQEAGIQIEYAVEIDKTIAETYILNHKNTSMYVEDIKGIDERGIFKGNKTSICKQIGNAVPPKLAFVLAEMAKEILK